MRSPGLDRLRAEIRSRPSDPYLLTVTADGRPHCGTVTVTGDATGGQLTAGPAPGTWAEAEAAGYRQVSLLWPPAEPGGYSLMADGTADSGPGGTLIVTVTRAVLHRRGPAPAGSIAACGSDCIPLAGRRAAGNTS